MKSAILSALFATLTFSATNVYARQAKEIKVKDSTLRTVSVGLTVGTSGIGIDTRTPLNKKLNLRFGASVLSCSAGQIFGINSGMYSADGNAMMNMAKFQMLLEYRLTSDIRIVGGAGYFYQSNIIADGKFLNSMKNSGLEMSAKEVSLYKVGILWQNINPYLGVSLLKDRPVGRFSMNMDMGVYYMSAPQSKWEFEAGKNSATLEANAAKYKQVLDDKLSTHRWFPVLQLSFNYLAVRKG